MFKARDYLHTNYLSILYHIYIFPYLIYCIEVWVMRPIVTYFPCFNTDKNYSVNHILETFSLYRTYIQIIKYSSTQQSLLSQNWTFNV